MKSGSYKDLLVWKKSMELVKNTYILTGDFPKEEVFGLNSQIKRSALSIPSNIAEGSKRKSKKEFINFLRISYGSGAELETQIEIGKELSFGKETNYLIVEENLLEVMKMLNGLISSLSKN